MFAGEDVDCTITFKNMAPVSGSSSPRSPLAGSATKQKQNGHLVSPIDGERRRPSIPLQATPKPARRPPPPSPSSRQTSFRGHKPTLSLDTPGDSKAASKVASPGPRTNGFVPPSHKHKRSISIISLGGSETTAEGSEYNRGSRAGQRPNRGHMRSASLQVLPRNPAQGERFSGLLNCYVVLRIN